MTVAVCPSCGLDLVTLEPFRMDYWTIHPKGSVWYKGREVIKRASWVNLMHAIASNGDTPISAEALIDRISDSENTNLLSVHIYRIRQHLAVQNVPDPIGTAYRRGYYWIRT